MSNVFINPDISIAHVASSASSAAAVFRVDSSESRNVCDCGVIIRDGGRFVAALPFVLQL